MNKKKSRKLALNTETLRLLTLREVTGALSNTQCVTACVGTCRSDCGSCIPCTHQPCPFTNDLSCPC